MRIVKCEDIYTNGKYESYVTFECEGRTYRRRLTYKSYSGWEFMFKNELFRLVTFGYDY